MADSFDALDGVAEGQGVQTHNPVILQFAIVGMCGLALENGALAGLLSLVAMGLCGSLLAVLRYHCGISGRIRQSMLCWLQGRP